MISDKDVALVTGGTRGIGLGIAKALAAHNFNVIITGVRDPGDAQEALASIQTQFSAHDQRVKYLQANVAHPDARAAMLAEVAEHFGRLDVLVNNAGIAPRVRADVLDASEESFDELIATNLKGPYFLTQAVGNWMIKQQEGMPHARYIINIGSVSATMASVNRGDYCLAKAGVAMATKLWATRLTAHGIAVYEVRPGVIETEMTRGVKDKYDAMMKGDLFLEKRWGTPQDIGKVVAMLATGNLPYAPGSVLNVDGGMTIPRL